MIGLRNGPTTRARHPPPFAVAASSTVSASGASTTSCSRITGTTAGRLAEHVDGDRQTDVVRVHVAGRQGTDRRRGQGPAQHQAEDQHRDDRHGHGADERDPEHRDSSVSMCAVAMVWNSRHGMRTKNARRLITNCACGRAGRCADDVPGGDDRADDREPGQHATHRVHPRTPAADPRPFHVNALSPKCVRIEYRCTHHDLDACHAQPFDRFQPAARAAARERRSPRSYDESAATISDAQFDAVLEAARWAASAMNHQPRRFHRRPPWHRDLRQDQRTPARLQRRVGLPRPARWSSGSSRPRPRTATSAPSRSTTSVSR